MCSHIKTVLIRNCWIWLIVVALSSCAMSDMDSSSTPQNESVRDVLTPWTLPYAPPDPEDERLALTFSLERTRFQVNTPIIYILALTNLSNEPILVKSRLSVNKISLIGAVGDVGFVLLDSSGNSVNLDLSIRSRNLRATDFRLLNPGEDIENSYDLSKLYRLEPDTYTLYALYVNTFDTFDGSVAWKGTLISDPVTFTIEP